MPIVLLIAAVLGTIVYLANRKNAKKLYGDVGPPRQLSWEDQLMLHRIRRERELRAMKYAMRRDIQRMQHQVNHEARTFYQD